jgi:hypothetical protein
VGVVGVLLASGAGVEVGEGGDTGFGGCGVEVGTVFGSDIGGGCG